MAALRARDDYGNSADLLIWLILGGLLLQVVAQCFLFLERKQRAQIVQAAGVARGRVARTIREIERKLFHGVGLAAPALYYHLSKHRGWPRRTCFFLFAAITAAGVAVDALRAAGLINIESPLLRVAEKRRLSGCSFFAGGTTLAVRLARRPAVAVVALVFLVVGDAAAALVGVSFGGAVAPAGPVRRKSWEGSAAMFASCFLCARYALFDVGVHVAACGAAAATVVELFQPLGVDDNLSIPVASVLALDVAIALEGGYG